MRRANEMGCKENVKRKATFFYHIFKFDPNRTKKCTKYASRTPAQLSATAISICRVNYKLFFHSKQLEK